MGYWSNSCNPSFPRSTSFLYCWRGADYDSFSFENFTKWWFLKGYFSYTVYWRWNRRYLIDKFFYGLDGGRKDDKMCIRDRYCTVYWQSTIFSSPVSINDSSGMSWYRGIGSVLRVLNPISTRRTSVTVSYTHLSPPHLLLLYSFLTSLQCFSRNWVIFL